MKETVDYINKIFGVNLDVQKFPKNHQKTLPIFITESYNIWEGILFGKKIIFIENKTIENFTPDQYKKHIELLEKAVGCFAILVLQDIEAYNRNRLIQKHINFIIANKQIFIPYLMIDIKEYLIKPAQKEYMQPVAQLLLLFHLQKGTLDKFNYRELSETLQYNYLTICRAVENLDMLGICNVQGAKDKTIHFIPNKKELWENANQFMKNPVKKQFFINEVLPEKLVFKTNINALANYTNINDDKRKYYAIFHENFRELLKKGNVKEYNDYDGKYLVELWKYNPTKLANKNFVDPLSLYLEFKDNPDERIQIELDKLIKNLW